MKKISKIQLSILSSLIIVSSSLLFLNGYAATYSDLDPDYPPSASHQWAFGQHNIFGWHVKTLEGDGPLDHDLIYNVTALKLLDDAFQIDESNFNAYGVVLQRMYWNTSSGGLKPYNTLMNYPLINASLINYTTGMPGAEQLMLPFNPEVGGTIETMEANPFIPINTSAGNLPDLAYCADMLYVFYDYQLSGSMSGTTDVSIATDGSTYWMISYTNTIHDTYAHLYYNIQGVLTTGEIYGYHDLDKFKVNYTKIEDFNPVNGLQWAYDVGDEFYMGQEFHEFHYKIIEKNETTTIQYGDIVSYQEIWANRTRWDGGLQAWTDPDITAIGRANENDPMVFTDDGGPAFYLLPENTQGCDVKRHWQGFADENGQVDSVSCGEDWVKIYNSNNESYVYMEYFANGQLKYLHTFSVNFMGSDSTVIYFKNSTIATTGVNEYELTPYGAEGDFTIKFTLDVSTNTHILFAAFDYLPIDQELENGLVYFDIWMNDTGLINELNITILYNGLYTDLELQKLQLGPSPLWQGVYCEINDNNVTSSESASLSSTVYGLSGQPDISAWITAMLKRGFEKAFEKAFKNAFARAIARIIERKLGDLI